MKEENIMSKLVKVRFNLIVDKKTKQFCSPNCDGLKRSSPYCLVYGTKLSTKKENGIRLKTRCKECFFEEEKANDLFIRLDFMTMVLCLNKSGIKTLKALASHPVFLTHTPKLTLYKTPEMVFVSYGDRMNKSKKIIEGVKGRIYPFDPDRLFKSGEIIARGFSFGIVKDLKSLMTEKNIIKGANKDE